MPVAIVDALERVEVAHQDRRPGLGRAAQAGQLLLHARHETALVGQLRQIIDRGEQAQLPLGLLALGDVGDEAAPDGAAVLAADAVLHGVVGRALLEMRLHGGADLGQVVGMDAPIAVLDPRREFVGVKAQNGRPAWGVANGSSLDVTIPNAGAAASDGQVQDVEVFAALLFDPGDIVGDARALRRKRRERGRVALLQGFEQAGHDLGQGRTPVHAGENIGVGEVLHGWHRGGLGRWRSHWRCLPPATAGAPCCA